MKIEDIRIGQDVWVRNHRTLVINRLKVAKVLENGRLYVADAHGTWLATSDQAHPTLQDALDDLTAEYNRVMAEYGEKGEELFPYGESVPKDRQEEAERLSHCTNMMCFTGPAGESCWTPGRALQGLRSSFARRSPATVHYQGACIAWVEHNKRDGWFMMADPQHFPGLTDEEIKAWNDSVKAQ